MAEYFNVLDTLMVSSVAGGRFDFFLVDFEVDGAGRGAVIAGAT